MKRTGAVYYSPALCIFLIVCASCKESARSNDSPDKTCSEVSSAQAISVRAGSAPRGWDRYSPPGLNMSVELPGAPQLYQAPIPEEMRRHYRSVVNYLYNDEALFVILSCNTSNRGPVKSPNLRDFTAGFVDGFKKSRRLSDINLTTIPDTLCRILLSGSYKRDDVWFEFEGFTQAKGENIWIVMLSYARGDGETKSLAKYASESVSLE